MKHRGVNLALGIVFLIVGILASYNTYELREYIRETLPRDQRQEQCNTETLTVLKSWLQVRKQRDAAMDSRDEASIMVLDRLVSGGQPSPAELARWREAVVHDRQVRVEADAQSPPLPAC